jgi:hypothetical protein
MQKMLIAMAVAGVSATLSAQVGVLSKGKPMTLRGEIIEISCYQTKGLAGATGAAHVACVFECAKQGKALGILTDGDGLFKIVGEWANNNNAKLVPYIGQNVDVTGAEVFVSNVYDIRHSFEVQKLVPIKARP